MAHALPAAAPAFPRRFDLAASRAARAGATALPPLTPAAYLRLCREAARRPLDLVALRIAPRPGDFEAAARGLFAGVIDVLEGVESGTARLDAAIVARLDERSHALIQALNLARPQLDQPVGAASPIEPEPEQ